MGSDLSPREKWELFLRGHDVGPIVGPLCDNWSLSVPYHWPYDEPEPFKEGHPSRALGEQIAMAEVCGWDPTFLAAIPFTPSDPALTPQVTTTRLDGGGTRTGSVVHTPYGDLTSVAEQKASSHAVKAELACEQDYRRKAWAVRRAMDYDEDGAIAAGQELARAVGDKGVLGTWFGPPAMALNHNEMHYHLADFPGAGGTMVAADLSVIPPEAKVWHASLVALRRDRGLEDRQDEWLLPVLVYALPDDSKRGPRLGGRVNRRNHEAGSLDPRPSPLVSPSRKARASSNGAPASTST